jgi:transcriptional repressor NF-X1
MALALDIDPDRESVPPYREETVFFYLKDKKWASGIEEKFRGFAESVQKRLVFPHMRSTQRAFLHSLAEDYGFVSISQDPEPYRSVVVHRGSGFTVAPKKTIMEFVASKPSAVSATVPISIQQLKKPRRQAYNAVLLQGIRVGILTSEIEKELEPVLKDSQLRFGLQWTGDEEVMLLPKASSLAVDQIELELADVLSPKLKRLFAMKGLADKVELVWVGRDGQIVNRESGGKWSLIAGGRSTNPPGSKVPVQAAVGGKSRFEFELGTAEMARKSAESRKKKKKEKEPAVVDDWETAADDEASIGPHI